MNTTDAKIELAKLVLNIDNPGLIGKVHNLIKDESSDFWTHLSDNEKREIELGLSQLNKGQKVAFEDYMQKVS